MAKLTPQDLSSEGTVVALTAADSNGDSFKAEKNAGYELRILNGSGSTITVTIDAKRLSEFGEDNDSVVSIDTTVEKAIRILLRHQAVGSRLVNWTYSDSTTVTVGLTEVS